LPSAGSNRDHFPCADSTRLILPWKLDGFRLAVAIVNSFFDWYIRIPTFFCYSIAEKVFHAIEAHHHKEIDGMS